MPQTTPTSMTPGLVRALSKYGGKRVCGSCGFPLPTYPGRYPMNCPNCKTPLKPKPDNNNDAAD